MIRCRCPSLGFCEQCTGLFIALTKNQTFLHFRPPCFGNGFAIVKNKRKRWGAKMKTIMVMTILVIASSSFAFDKEDNTLDFRQALMESNKDYNDHKKEMLNEDNDRISDWNSQQAKAFTITAGIQQEARDYRVDPEQLAKEAAEKLDLQEYQQRVEAEKNNSDRIHEISMNQ